MSRYPERLAEAFRASGLSRSQLAKALGVSHKAVSKALTGETKALSASHSHEAALILRVCPGWLATGKGSSVSTGQDLLPLSDAEAKLVALLRALPDAAAAAAHTAARAVAEQQARLLEPLAMPA